MPRNTENIRYDIDTEPDGLDSVRSSHRVFVIHKNTIGLPAGNRTGKCRTKNATKNIQKRYWETGIPMGMELEAENDGQVEDECWCDCDYCYNGDHGYDCGCEYGSGGSDIHSWPEVRNIIQESNKHIYKRMRDYAIKTGKSSYPWISPVIAKYDGSLNCGVEFNFQPMTVDAFRPVAQIVEDNKGGLSGFYTETAGIHIHIPKSAFTDAELYLFLILWRTFQQYTNNDGETFLEVIAQRGSNNWCEYNTPYHFNEYEDVRNGKIGKVFYDVIKNNRRSAAGRYSALNFNGHGTTMEVRAFNSNLIADRLVKNMAFLDASWRYVHLLSDYINEGRYKQALQYVTDLHSFVSYCKNPLRKGFAIELATFLDKRWDDSDSFNKQSIVYATDLLPYLIQLNEEDNYGDNQL